MSVPESLLLKLQAAYNTMEFPIVNYHLKSNWKLVPLEADVTSSKLSCLIIEN